jgi:hypothetical protein
MTNTPDNLEDPTRDETIISALRSLQAKVATLQAEIAQLKSGKAVSVEARIARGAPAPSTIEEMAGARSRAAQSTSGWFGASPDLGEVRLLSRGNATAAARNAIDDRLHDPERFIANASVGVG